MKSSDWNYWKNLAHVELLEAVTLSCGVDPECMGAMDVKKILSASTQSAVRKIRERHSIALSHIESGKLTASKSGDKYFVGLADFRAWGESLPASFSFPEQFPRGEQTVQTTRAASERWPWGPHETHKLCELAAAAERFWKNYDPKDPGTAPRSKAVVAWLVNRGIAKRVAETMAQILRADGLRNGPR